MILVACPIKDREWAIPHWYGGIEDNMDAAPLHVVALVSKSEDNTEEMLGAFDVEIVHDDEPGRPVQQIGMHIWDPGRYVYMSRLRNQLVEMALDMDADYFLSLDSDIVLPRGGLEQLLNYSFLHGGVVAPAVQMSTGHCAWNTMSWNDRRYPGMANRDRPPSTGRADVVMAAMLLDRKAMECRWSANLGGEDIGFCLDCEEKAIPRWWMSEVRCRHLMHPI